MELADKGYIYLYFVRHGETDWNLTKRVQGQTDISLNPTGVKQAKEASSRFENVNFSSFYASDLKRATETATILQQQLNFSHAPLNTDKALRERFFGELEGLTYTEVSQYYINENINLKTMSKESIMELRVANGETYSEMLQRTMKYVDKIVKRANGNVLIVTHGNLMKCLFAHHKPNHLNKVHVDNVAHFVLRYHKKLKTFDVMEYHGVTEDK